MNTSIASGNTSPQAHLRRRMKGLRFWTGRVLLGFGVALAALSAVGASYQAIATANERRNFVPAGQFVDEVAAFARVVAYDRPALGWSEDGGQPHDGLHIAQQLHTALQHARITDPYVFVGHSAGGLYAHAFAAQYPNEVAAMVFVDATTP